MAKAVSKACGNPECSTSTGIHGGLTCGSGRLDDHGFWENPCKPCARAVEKALPQYGQAWPYEDVDVEAERASVRERLAQLDKLAEEFDYLLERE